MEDQGRKWMKNVALFLSGALVIIVLVYIVIAVLPGLLYMM